MYLYLTEVGLGRFGITLDGSGLFWPVDVRDMIS